MADTCTILGIESSCDDTAAAIVRQSGGSTEVLSSIVAGQAQLHAAYGGVVPEIAARAHTEMLDICIKDALEDTALTMADIDAVAITWQVTR